MATRIQFSRGTAARWTTVNPILAQGELGLETDTGRMKMGDGTTAWSSLAYFAAGAMLAVNNLSELVSPSAARTNLGLGGAAVLNVGTSAGTVAAGDDSRITGAAQKSANLSDLASASTARTNLGLGGLAVLSAVAINLITATGTPGAGNVLRGDGAWAGVDTTMFAANVIDTDATLAAASNTRIATQAAVKSYIDNALTGLFWKAAVDVATTANITLSGEQTIDGVLTSGSRVLVKNQSTASQNGIYVSAAGAWSRATDADAGAELVSAAVFVKQGTANGDTQWTCTNNSITIGSTSIAFAQVSGAGTYSAGSFLQLSGNQFSLSATGTPSSGTFLRGDNTWSVTVAGSDTQVQFNDGGALAGNSGLTFDKTNGSLTVGGATVTTSQPVLNLTQTWNAGGVTFTGLNFNVTDTASASGSLLMDLKRGGTSQFSVNKNGFITANASNSGLEVATTIRVTTAGSATLWNAGLYAWSSTGVPSGTADTFIGRAAAASIRLGAGDAAAPVAQTLGVQSVVAGTSNTAGVNFTIKGSTSTGSGTAGSIIFQVGGTGAAATAQNSFISPWQIAGGTGHFLAGTDNTYDIGTAVASRPRNVFAGTSIRAPYARVDTAYTVATLPTAFVGMVARVSDASAPAIGSTVAGGGAAHALVWYNNANWTVIGV